MSIETKYNSFNLKQKRQMFELILWNDVMIFNEEYKLLNDSNHVCFVSINGTAIQLTIHEAWIKIGDEDEDKCTC